jgi:biopolymer transport protein ExbD
MNFRSRYKPDTVGFQIAPMVDIMLFLLCFFVTLQIYMQWETEIGITLPTARTAQLENRLPGEIILNIFKNGDVVVNGRKLKSDELAGILKHLAKNFSGQPVLIRADQETAFAHVIRVLDLCKRSDIWNISFATVKGEEKAVK